MNTHIKALAAAVGISLLSGCATGWKEAQITAQVKAMKEKTAEINQREPIKDGFFVPSKPTVFEPEALTKEPKYSLKVNGILALTAAQTLAKEAKVKIYFANGVNSTKSISLDIDNEPIDVAIDRIAEQMGLVVVRPDGEKEPKYVLAPRATYVYSLPRSMSRDMNAPFSMSAQPLQGGVGATSNSGVTADVKQSKDEFLQLLQKQAGDSAVITHGGDRSTKLFVTADAPTLRRLDRIIKQEIYESSIFITGKLNLIQLNVKGGLQTGIEWDKVFSSGKWVFDMPSVVVNNGLTLTKLKGDKATQEAVIKALEEYGDARVLASPDLNVPNRGVANLTSVRSEPYLGEVKADVVTQQSGPPIVTKSGKAESAVNSTSIQLSADVVGENTVQFRLIPVISIVEDLKKFIIDPSTGSSVSKPVVTAITGYGEPQVEQGRTVLISGMSMSNVSGNYSGIPGAGGVPLLDLAGGSKNSQTTVSDLLIMISVTIVRPPKDFNPRVQSLL